MSALLWKKKLIIAKIESTYGTDPTPDGTNDAMLTKNMAIVPIEGGAEDRGNIDGNLGNHGNIHTGEHVSCSFDMELAGSGAAGDAPKFDPLLESCGLLGVNSPGTSEVYKPVSSSFKSCTIYLNIDGQLHILTGCRGNVSFSLNKDEVPMMSFSFKGIYNAPSTVSMVTPVVSAFQTPIPVSKTNTPTGTIHSVSALIESLSIDLGNTFEYFDYINSEEVNITDRAPSGNIAFQAPALSTKNWFTVALADTQDALQVIHGTAAGNKVQIDCPLVQLLLPSYSDSNGVANIQADLAIVPTIAGDDEFVLTFT
jgi:hypothetical protein